jgi:hypothetical protein
MVKHLHIIYLMNAKNACTLTFMVECITQVHKSKTIKMPL